MPKSPKRPTIRLTPEITRSIAAIEARDRREAERQPPAQARLFLTFETAMTECRAAAATGFMSHAPGVRLEKALAWADDLATADLIPAEDHVRLHAEIRARARAGRI